MIRWDRTPLTDPARPSEQKKLLLPTLLLLFIGLFTSEATWAQVPATEARTNPRIINGDPVKFGQGPWAASVQYLRVAGEPNSARHSCGGSFVSPLYRSFPRPKVDGWLSDAENPFWLVTAAHCVFDESGKQLEADRLIVLGGALNLLEREKGEFQRVKAVLPHEKYNPRTLENDVALLRLETSTKKISATLRSSIRFPLPSDTAWINEPYLAVRAQGWGRTETGSSSNELREVLLPLTDKGTCQRRYSVHGAVIGDGVLCAGFVSGDFDSCQGDSGGPLVYRPQGQTMTWSSSGPVLIGVVSWGIGCGTRDLLGVYTSASYYRRWAEERIVTYEVTGK